MTEYRLSLMGFLVLLLITIGIIAIGLLMTVEVQFHQVGNQILKTYEMDGEWITDISNAGGGAGNGGESNSKKEGDPGYNPFGFVFTTKDGKESPVTPSKGRRDAKFIDASIIEFFTDLFGPEMALGYEYDYKKESESNVKQNFKYESFKADVPYLQNTYKLRKIEKDTFMYPSDYYNTNWGRKSMIDSNYEQLKMLSVRTNNIT